MEIQSVEKLNTVGSVILNICNLKSEKTGSTPVKATKWKDGRVVDYTALEKQHTARYQGFESLSFRWRVKEQMQTTS